MYQKMFKPKTQTRWQIFRWLKMGAVNPTQKIDAHLEGEITLEEYRENSQKKLTIKWVFSLISTQYSLCWAEPLVHKKNPTNKQ